MTVLHQINTSKGDQEEVVTAGTTFTLNGTPADDTWFGFTLTANSGGPYTVTLPAGTWKSEARASATITTFTINASERRSMQVHYDGAVYWLYNDPSNFTDLPANTTPATTDLFQLQNPTTGIYSKSTLAQVITAGGGGGTVSDTAYASSWNGVVGVAPSKNAVYDWAHTFDTDDDGKVDLLDNISAAGLVRAGATGLVTGAAELSGDVTTSGSNAVTVTKINGTSLGGLSTGILRNTTTTGVPSAAELSGDISTSGSNVTAIGVGKVTDAMSAQSDKPAVFTVAETNVTLSGEQALGGAATSSGSTLLLAGQSTASQNGPWVTAAGTWARPAWFVSGSTAHPQFSTVFVRTGNRQGTTWRLTTAAPITVDTTSETWAIAPLNITTSGNVTGSLPIANGGTGGTSAITALDSLITAEATVASNTTTNVFAATTRNVQITGVTTISAFDTATAGIMRWGRFSGVLTITYNATSMILPGQRDWLTQVGDTFNCVSLGSGNTLFYNLLHADGTPAVVGTLNAGTNPGAVTTFDATITSAAAAAIEESFGINVDGVNLFKVYSESDGAGGLQNKSVQVPAGSLLLGTAGSVIGSVGFRNATSGTATLNPPVGALGTYSVVLPNAASTLPIYGAQITYTGPTAARTVTYPDASFTIARTDAANTFTGTQTFSGQIVSSLATGTAPFSIASTTNVANLNASSLNSATFTAPGPIGSGTASTGAFTTLTSNGATTFTANTASTTSTTGTLVVTGGVGISGKIFTGDDISTSASFTARSGNTNNQIQVTASGLFFGSGTDTCLQRNSAAASLLLGKVASATPVAYTYTIGESSRSGTDTNVGGASGTIKPGLGTGTGTASQIILSTPTVTGSGTGAQSYAARVTVDSSGTAFSGPTTHGSAGTAITNIRHGISGAMVLGSVTITDAGCTANTRYFFTAHTLGTITVPGGYYAMTRNAGTSVVVVSSQATETSTLDWMAIEP